MYSYRIRITTTSGNCYYCSMSGRDKYEAISKILKLQTVIVNKQLSEHREDEIHLVTKMIETVKVEGM